MRELIAGRFGYDISRPLEEIRPTYTFDVSCQGTVPVAVRAFMESDDFEDAVRKAISLGGDSDTIARIAGAIAHAHYGNVPKHIAEPVVETFMDPRLIIGSSLATE